MRSFFRKAAIVLAVVFILFFIGYQIYKKIVPEYRTETAYNYTMSQTLAGDGVIFRNEQVLSADKSGVVVYTVSDGTKIAKDSVIANTYSSEDDATKQLQIEQVDEQIDLINQALSPAFGASVSTGDISKQIFNKINAIQSKLSDNDLPDIKALKSDLAAYLLKTTALTDQSDQLNAKLTELQNKKSSLQSSLSSQPKTVTSDIPGYFVSTIDGYEDSCSLSKVYSYSSAQLLELAQKAPGQTSDKMGKVISDYHWIYAAVVDQNGAKDLTEGKKVTISFPFSDVNDIPATIIKITREADTDKAIIYLQCEYMNDAISNLRNQKVSINTYTYSGLRIPPAAVHIVDGVKGVYIIYNEQILFRKINTIYESDQVVIADIVSGDNSYLRQYDQVIVEGKDLYDGKLC